MLAVVASLVLGGASLVLSPLLALAGLLGLAAALIIASRPEFGLLIIVVITGGLVDAEQLPLLGLGPISLHLTDILLFYMLGVLVVRALVDHSFRLVTTPLDLPVAAFQGALIFSAALAIMRFSVDATDVLRQLRPLTYYLAFFVVTNLVRDQRQLKTLLTGLMVIAVVASLALLVQVVGQSLFGWDLQLGRVREYTLTTAGREYEGIVRTYMQADRLVYPMLLVSMASLILHRGDAARRSTLWRLIRTVMLGAGIFLSFQRNYWITLALMTGLLFVIVGWHARLRAVQWVLLGVGVLAAALSLPGTMVENYVIAAEDRLIWGMHPETLAEDSSTQWRLMETEYALQTVAQRPMFGIGMGNTYRPWVPDDAYFRPENPSLGLRWYMHNAYLWVWVMAGAVGLVPFLMLYGIFVLRGLRRWRGSEETAPRDRERSAVVLGFTLAILGQMVGNIVAPNFLQSWSLVIFAIILGINEVIYRLDAGDTGKGEQGKAGTR